MFSTFMGSMVRWLRCHTCLAGWLVALSLWWMCYITFLTTQLGPFYESDILNFLFVGIPARATMFVSMGGVLYACYGWCKKFFVALYGVCIAFFALLTPYALVYKLPISVAVTSIKYTHWVEAQGFMAQLPLGCYVQAMLFCCVAVYSCVLVVHHSQQGGVSRHSVVVGVVGLLLTLFNPVRFYLGGEFVGPEYIYTVIASSHNPLVRIPVKVLEKLHEEASAQAVLAQRPDWRIEHTWAIAPANQARHRSQRVAGRQVQYHRNQPLHHHRRLLQCKPRVDERLSRSFARRQPTPSCHTGRHGRTGRERARITRQRGQACRHTQARCPVLRRATHCTSCPSSPSRQPQP